MGSWDDPDWTNIQDAIGEIVTQGGQLSSSNVGAWNGTLLTATFSDRDSSLFQLLLDTNRCEDIYNSLES